MARTPQQVADDWASKMQNAQQKITDGINGVTEAPTQKAAQNLGKYLQSTQDAVNSGKMAARLNAVTLQQWKSAALAKVSRVGAGAAAAKDKVTRFLTQWLPFVAQVRQQVKALPNVTPQDRINRMVQNATMLSQFKQS